MRTIFWKPEGPLMRVNKRNTEPNYAWVIQFEDLNPQMQKSWCLDRKTIFKIAFGLLWFAIRGK